MSDPPPLFAQVLAQAETDPSEPRQITREHFEKGIGFNGRPVVINHNPARPNTTASERTPIGQIITGKFDDAVNGVMFGVLLNGRTNEAKDVRREIMNGRYWGASIGANYSVDADKKVTSAEVLELSLTQRPKWPGSYVKAWRQLGEEFGWDTQANDKPLRFDRSTNTMFVAASADADDVIAELDAMEQDGKEEAESSTRGETPPEKMADAQDTAAQAPPADTKGQPPAAQAPPPATDMDDADMDGLDQPPAKQPPSQQQPPAQQQGQQQPPFDVGKLTELLEQQSKMFGQWMQQQQQQQGQQQQAKEQQAKEQQAKEQPPAKEQAKKQAKEPAGSAGFSQVDVQRMIEEAVQATKKASQAELERMQSRLDQTDKGLDSMNRTIALNRVKRYAAQYPQLSAQWDSFANQLGQGADIATVKQNMDLIVSAIEGYEGATKRAGDAVPGAPPPKKHASQSATQGRRQFEPDGAAGAGPAQPAKPKISGIMLIPRGAAGEKAVREASARVFVSKEDAENPSPEDAARFVRTLEKMYPGAVDFIDAAKYDPKKHAPGLKISLNGRLPPALVKEQSQMFAFKEDASAGPRTVSAFASEDVFDMSVPDTWKL